MNYVSRTQVYKLYMTSSQYYEGHKFKSHSCFPCFFCFVFFSCFIFVTTEFVYSTTMISHIFKRYLTVRQLHTFNRGVKEVLQKRLKNHIKREKLVQAKLAQEKRRNEVHFYCVIDFEATCEEDNPKDYIHEIIEFPAVLVDATTLEVVSELLRC